MLADRDDRAGGRPASGPAGAGIKVTSPLVGTHGLNGRIDVVAKAALGLLPGDNVGACALKVRSEVGPRVGIDSVEGPQPNVRAHKKRRVDAAGSNLRGHGGEDGASEGRGSGLNSIRRMPMPATKASGAARAAPQAGASLLT